MAIEFKLNGEPRSVDAAPDKPLLWVIREDLGLTGTKFGCGIAQCGACTVHLDGSPIRACSFPLAAAAGRDITTIEGLEGPAAEAVVAAWREIDVVQCGYCQSGQIMSATALLGQNPAPTDADIDGAMSGNLCRCGTYVRIRKAIHDASDKLEGKA
ncbi:MAG: (2Fe-2S)-binding protein [Pseudomonadota bacterium]